ncbi:MAG: T9SS type A sorting domain-containing protein [Bacteroidota bacterium]
MRLDLWILLMILLAGTSPLAGQAETGIAWEFNNDGDAEGWMAESGLEQVSVKNGSLSGVTTLTQYPFPKFSSGEFSIPADQYGYIDIRLKAPGADFARLSWDDDQGGFFIATFDLAGDHNFHNYRLSLVGHDRWKDNIIRLPYLSIHEAPVGTKVEIDYIRILHLGPVPEITRFRTERITIQPGDTVPLYALVSNSGDEPVSMRSELMLHEGIELLEGAFHHDHGTLLPLISDTLRWQITCSDTGTFNARLRLFSDTDSIDSVLPVHVTDRRWEQKEFLLSAWSPPYAWYAPPYRLSVFDRYQKANFDVALWARPEDDLTGLLEQYGQKYFILVTKLLGGDEYLREPSTHVAPPITPEMLARLDPIIEKYRNNPNVLGYHICDEPYDACFENIGKVVKYIRERDPERLNFVNIWPGEDHDRYRNYIEDLLDQTKLEILSYDRYIFHNGFDEQDKFFSNIRVIREYAGRYNIPFYNIFQAIGTDGTIEEHLNWRTPTPAEHRWQVYASLAYGAKGLIWFHWHGNWGVTGNPDGAQVAASIGELNPEIKRIGKEMMRLRSTLVFHTDPGDPIMPENQVIKGIEPVTGLVVGLFLDTANQDYFMLMNKDYEHSVTATITLTHSFDEISMYNAVTDIWEAVEFSNGRNSASFQVTLMPGGGKLIDASKRQPVGVEGPEHEPQPELLLESAPNPFGHTTQLHYTIARQGSVSLRIYDHAGRLVRILVDKYQERSTACSSAWDGKNSSGREVPPGIYVARLSSEGHNKAFKLVKTE